MTRYMHSVPAMIRYMHTAPTVIQYMHTVGAALRGRPSSMQPCVFLSPYTEVGQTRRSAPTVLRCRCGRAVLGPCWHHVGTV